MSAIKEITSQRVSWHIIFALFLLIVILSASITACGLIPHSNELRIVSIPESLNCNSSALNYWQLKSPYLLHVYKNQLFFYNGSSTFIGCCVGKTVFSVATLAEIVNGEGIGGLCFVDSLFYFRYFLEDECYVKAIDIVTKELFDIGMWHVNECAPFEDMFYSPVDNNTYLQIDSKGAGIRQIENNYIEAYTIDNAKIIKEFYHDIRYGNLKKIDSQGNIDQVIENFDLVQYCLYQLEDGRIIVYNLGTVRRRDALLWIIDKKGTVLPVFPGVTGANVDSSANVCGNKLYISFMRYEKWGPLYSRKFKNDKISGTWVIDLENYQSTKLSDIFYEGLYVFGDDVIGVENNRFSIIH